MMGGWIGNRKTCGQRTVTKIHGFWTDHLLQNRDEEPDLILIGMQ